MEERKGRAQIGGGEKEPVNRLDNLILMGRVDIWVGGRRWLEMAYFGFGGGFR